MSMIGMLPDANSRAGVGGSAYCDRMVESGLSFDTALDDGVARLVVAGEVDLTSAGALADRALALLEAGPTQLVVDMSGVTFCDSAGLNALFRVYARAEEKGARLTLRSLNAPVYRIFDATGATTVLSIDG
jgi:anti-sigma B factor antagonist